MTQRIEIPIFLDSQFLCVFEAKFAASDASNVRFYIKLLNRESLLDHFITYHKIQVHFFHEFKDLSFNSLDL